MDSISLAIPERLWIRSSFIYRIRSLRMVPFRWLFLTIVMEPFWVRHQAGPTLLTGSTPKVFRLLLLSRPLFPLPPGIRSILKFPPSREPALSSFRFLGIMGD